MATTIDLDDASVSDFLFLLRDEASAAAETLRLGIVQIEEKTARARVVLDRLDAMARKAEDGAQLVAASNIEPDTHALAPIGSGFETPNTDGRPGSCAQCSYAPGLHQPEGPIEHAFVQPDTPER